jgi:hypothetical protein
MKRIDPTQETATSWSPYKVESKAFMQDANKEMIAALCINIITNHGLTYSGTTPYLITTSNVITPIGIYLPNSDGAVFYNGELYLMLENTGLTYAVIDNSINTAADPTTFSDGTTHNIHKNRYLNFTNTSAGSLFAVADIVDLTKANTQSLSFLNSWSASESVLVYKQVFNKIEFKGSVSKATTSGGVIFNLPVGYRPSVQRYIPITLLQSSTVVQDVLIVEVLGDCYLLNTPTASSTLAILNGISFYL